MIRFLLITPNSNTTVDYILFKMSRNPVKNFTIYNVLDYMNIVEAHEHTQF